MLTLADFFCGAGGSSTGAIQVPGVELRVAANHWNLAVETHNANHPLADHIQADLSQYDPRYFPRSDIGWFSPECTNHSRAKGRKAPSAPDLFGDSLPDEAAERSRATMWDVVRFTEHHRYRAVIVENVVEVTQWLPYQAWLAAMDSLGYAHQVVSLNSAHAQWLGMPAPQSRDRVYVVFWRRGDRAPDLGRMQRPYAWCPSCGQMVRAVQTWKNGRTIGRYRSQYVYRCPDHACRGQLVEPAWLPAASAIDWSIPGQRIGDRPKPLAAKTRARIAAGIARYWHPIPYDAADPAHVSYGDPNAYYRAWSMWAPLKTLHTLESKALAVPVEGRDGKVAQPLTDPLRTQTTRAETGLAFIAELRGGGSTARPTITAGGSHHGLVVPAGGTWSDQATSTGDPLRSLTTRDAYGLVVPYYSNGNASRASDPMPTLTTVDRHALVMDNNHHNRARPTYEPMPTVTTATTKAVLAPGDVRAAEAQVDDVLFRMLEPSEAKRGMAFPDEYVMLGNRREQVKLAGNAVTPPAARDLIGCVVEALTGEGVAA